jgi:hypothetical protein
MTPISMISILVAQVATGLGCVCSHHHFHYADCGHLRFSTLIHLNQQAHLTCHRRQTSSPRLGGWVFEGFLQNEK